MKVPPRSFGSAQARARTSYATRRIVLPAQEFFHTETSSGVVLLGAAVAALLWANSPWGSSYDTFWNQTISFTVGSLTVIHSLREWVNDALMVVFFFVVGLEVKREFVHGELSGWQRSSLPVLCALGGMVVPAALYSYFNAGLPTARGWGIPMATDIAFALGILALAGDRVPTSARIFLLALATADDIGAILVIALFYSEHVSFAALIAGGLLVAFILVMRGIGVQSLMYYFAVGGVFWFATLESGVHATIAGVVLGLITPTKPYLNTDAYARSAEPLFHGIREAVDHGDSSRAEALLGEVEELTAGTEAPADRLIRLLHPWSAYAVLPVFALANAGVLLNREMVSQAAASPATRGIVVGLVLGKLIGILLFAYAALRLGIAKPLSGVSWPQMAGLGLVGGIGFTVSLFIASLGLSSEVVPAARAGILAASLVAGAAGYFTLRVTRRKRD
jgi:NhaA family Na+:H+ antiporter